MKTTAKVGRFADVRLGLSVFSAQEEHCWRRWYRGEELGIVVGSEFQAFGQHGTILVGLLANDLSG